MTDKVVQRTLYCDDVYELFDENTSTLIRELDEKRNQIRSFVDGRKIISVGDNTL